MKRNPVTRRTFLATSAAAGAAAATQPLPAWGQATKTLKVRSYVAQQTLDPLDRQGAPDQDVMDGLFPGLIMAKGGQSWDYELVAANSVEQVDATHIKFELK